MLKKLKIAVIKVDYEMFVNKKIEPSNQHMVKWDSNSFKCKGLKAKYVEI